MSWAKKKYEVEFEVCLFSRKKEIKLIKQQGLKK